ncbi:PREDICTED: vacuolar protein-sorting-associated protein 25-like [Priapulus caudatus]|uniref:Vacuolar protein-sorting-associated protein 25 n=1 Tax=Priapulus caudatus TaxID=37621 RepID=A0ABM1E2Y4_PRICU|nr:PREDICTED: vacuolar protein-sorting-associated protein 25-like [Priapulus caudatus]
MAAPVGNFEFPWQYSFQPFFTLQPNLDTRKKQVEAWCSLILAYHRHERQYILDVVESQNSPLFCNKEINRKLRLDDVQYLLEELQKKGNVEWLDKTQTRCYILWRTIEEWGTILYGWAADNGKQNTVCTLYEITNGEDTAGEDFHGLDTNILLRVLRALERQKKAEVFSLGDSEGVKFF